MRPETVDDLFARFGRAYVPLVMAAGMMASFIMVVSSTIVNVAIPDVMGAFGIGQDQAQLMATAFNVSMTASQLLNAWVVAGNSTSPPTSCSPGWPAHSKPSILTMSTPIRSAESAWRTVTHL